jgi:protein involved in polysaccharide export with SLBB domain
MAQGMADVAVLLSKQDEGRGSSFAAQKGDDAPLPLAIEDSLFILNPGDKIRVQWWGTGTGDLSATVDTRRKLLLPEIGEIQTRSRTLRDVRDTIEALIKSKFRPRMVSIRLIGVQPATVWLTGVLPSPGSQQIAPGTSLSKALALGGVVVSELLKVSKSTPPPHREDGMILPSLRRILLIRNGKDSQYVDLARAFRFGRVEQDPPLFSGDRVVLFPEERYCALNSGLTGAGVIEFHAGDTIRSVLEAAGIQVIPFQVRLVDSKGEERVANVDQTMDSGVTLINLDRPLDADRRHVVFIGGRVLHPGAYFLRPGMTIRDLVKLAGEVVGGEDSTIVVGVRRGGVNILPGRRPGLDALSAIPEVAKSYQAYLGTWRGIYSHGDLPLEPEDSVLVKTAQRVVWVGGRVMRPGFVPWVKGRSLEQYVDDVGGYTSDAWKSRVQMIHPITEQPGSPEGEILPGAALVVPEKRYIPPEQWITISVSVVSLVSSIVTIFLLLDSRS